MKKWTNLLLFSILIGFVACNSKSDPNEQINKELTAISTYLTANNTDYVFTDGYGESVVVHQIGNDAPPHKGQTVMATYTMRLFPDNTVIKANGVINDKIENLTSVLGLQSALTYLLKGSHATIYIPSQNAFGSAGDDALGVPPNTTVVYDITLDSVVRTDAELAQFKADTTMISTYIKDVTHKISGAVKHPSGIWYTNDHAGSNTHPTSYDVITAPYEGLILSTDPAKDDKSFDSGTLTNYNIFNLIDGLKIGLPLVSKGDNVVFYIPSGLGYGASKNGNIVENSSLKFKISITAIAQ